jgi:hypothetical protein
VQARGVVDQHVHAAGGGVRVRDDAPPRVGARDVVRDEAGRSADLLGHREALVLEHVAEPHARALRGQPLRDRRAGAARRARHDRDLAVELHRLLRAAPRTLPRAA